MAKKVKQNYSYASDEHGNLIHIKNANSEESYKCPICQKLMIQRKGQKRRWHFAHKIDAQCNYETYLHKIAKMRIRQTFYNSDQFIIKYNAEHTCNLSCSLELKEKCTTIKEKQFDLRQWYDICEEECEVNGFRADLLFRSSKNRNRQPLLIEIAVTHKSTQDKIQSGLRIIEIGINNEEDIESIVQKSTIIGKNAEYYFSKEDNTIFYNFKKSYPIELSKDMWKEKYIFGLKENNSIMYKSYLCMDFPEEHLILEYDIIISSSPIDWASALYLFEKLGRNVINCIRCKFYKYNEYCLANICILYKQKDTPRHPYLAFASNCRFYKPSFVNNFNEPIEEIEKQIHKIYNFNETGKKKIILCKYYNELEFK